MKKKNGFTLIELLSVIILLSIIALIAIPTVVILMENSKKSALKDSAQGLIRAAQYYNSNRKLKGDPIESTITFIGPNYQTENEKLEFNGEHFEGVVNIDENNNISLAIYNENYCAYKKTTDVNVTLTEVTSLDDCKNILISSD